MKPLKTVNRFCVAPSILVLNVCLFASLCAQGKFQKGSLPIRVSSVQELKRHLTATEEKLSSDLLQLMDQRFLPEGTVLHSHAETMRNLKQFRSRETGVLGAETVKDGEVYVYIHLEPDGQLEALRPLCTDITDVDEGNHLVVAWVKVKNLENVASLNGVKGVQSVAPAIIRTGSVTTEGDAIHKTADVRSTYFQEGSGVKVGIISNGVNHRSSSQSSNDLPADGSGLTVLHNTLGGDEGTAMLEIVHDMVPSSELYFHDQGQNTLAFRSAIDALVSAGCKVLCDDVGWYQEPFFEDGVVAKHVASVLSENDVVYVSAAGNDGYTHYQGDYYPVPSSTLHDFSGGTSEYYFLYINMSVGAQVTVVLQWNDQFGSSANDYDLSLYTYPSGTRVASSWNRQNGNDDPLESFSYTATAAGDYAIIVDKYSGDAKTLEVFIYPYSGTGVYMNSITPVDAIFGHPAVVGAIAVGAVRVTTPNTIESFSSQGPSTITYPSSESRTKPDLVAVDGGVITGAGSFGTWDGSNWRFYGTSASAPHVAAVVAQLWAQFPDKTGDEIREMVKATAVDLGAAGFDNVYGAGRADAWNAFDTYVGPVPIQLVSFSACVVRNNDVGVTWKTVSETNNYGFDLYRKRGDTGEWKKITFVEGHGTTLLPHFYLHVDRGVAFGKYSYQVKQIDLDGKSTAFPEVDVVVGVAPDKLILSQNYPNPFNPSTVIEFAVPQDGPATMKVYDICGQEVATLFEGHAETGKIYTARFNDSNLAGGMYFYRLQSSGKTETRRMVLMK
jgi:hypothetical protein